MKNCAHDVGLTPLSFIRQMMIALAILLALGMSNGLQAIEVTPITYTWTGTGQSDELYDSGNWLNELAPPSTSWAASADIVGINLVFGDARRSYLTYTDLYASQIQFQGNQPYYLDNQSYETTHIGSGGIIYNPSESFHSRIDGPVQLHASQIWNISTGTLRITGTVSDYVDWETSQNYQIEKTGSGTLELGSSYGEAWGGGLKLTDGLVVFRSMMGSASGSLGSGTLTFNGGTLKAENGEYEYYSTGGIEMSNNIVSNGLISLITRESLKITNSEAETNFFRLDADTTIEIQGKEVYVDKDITESTPSKLTFDAKTALILYGSSGWTGGTHIKSGAVIFGGEDNTPGTTGGIKIDSDGYTGIGVDNNVAAFLSEIDKTNSYGTIGFDSDLEQGVDTFTSNVDLTGFNSTIRLGSATAAILSGTITPQGTDYRFGGGGGSLFVASQLSDSAIIPVTAPGVAAISAATPSNVIVESPAEAPLTVQFLNPSNSFSGTLQVNDSAVIFGDGVPLPGTGSNFTMNAGGYIGNAHDPDGSATELSISSFLGHFATTTPGIIGFDITTDSYNERTVDLTGVDLTGFTGGVYLGTASVLRDGFGDISGAGVEFTGTIGADSSGVHRFAAYKGGALNISGTLTGTSMIIGSPDSRGSFGDQQRQQRSVVSISGNNTGKLANGVTLYGGELKVGQATGDGTIGTDATNALGSGTISVMPLNFNLGDGEDDENPPEAALTVSADGIIINNPIALSADLLVGDSRNFTLGGVISGNGGISIGDDPNDYVNITFAGNNTFSGGVYINDSNTATFTHNNAAGMGPLGFGGSYGGTANFETANPVIYGLRGENSNANLNLNYSGNRILTINQAEDTRFNGYINGSGDSTVVKEGIGTFVFDGGNITSSGIADGQGNNVALEIKEGAFFFGQNASLSNGDVKVSGGTLAIQGGTNFYNAVTITSGRIAGFGNYTSDISIGAGALLSPGLAGHGLTGGLQFSHLELNSGGVYEFHVQDPDPENYHARDHVSVTDPSTLVINATSLDPFTIKVISVGANGEEGMLSGIDPGFGLYSWTLFSFNSLSIPGNSNVFDASLFSLDLSAFTSDALYGGDFSLFEENNNLMLGFTPVPEPSTYAMMALGISVIGFMAWRRRRSQS